MFDQFSTTEIAIGLTSQHAGSAEARKKINQKLDRLHPSDDQS